MRSHRWGRIAALLWVIPALLIPSRTLLAQGAGKGQEKGAASAHANLGPGHLPMPERPFALPEDHALRLVSIAVDPTYKNLLGLRTNGWLGSDAGESGRKRHPIA